MDTDPFLGGLIQENIIADIGNFCGIDCGHHKSKCASRFLPFTPPTSERTLSCAVRMGVEVEVFSQTLRAQETEYESPEKLAKVP